MLGVYVGELDLHQILDHLVGDRQTFAQQSCHHVHDFLVQLRKPKQLLLFVSIFVVCCYFFQKLVRSTFCFSIKRKRERIGEEY